MRASKTTRAIVLFWWLCLAASVQAQSSSDDIAKTAFDRGTSFLYQDILTSADPTTFESIEYRGRETLEHFYDGRLGDYVRNNTYSFRATFRDSVRFMVHVNSEFGDRGTAEPHARKYSIEIGRLPDLLRREIQQVHVNAGAAKLSAAGEGYGLLTIHVGSGQSLQGRGFLEELLLHELIHVSSIDESDYDWSKEAYVVPDGWRHAQREDGVFISPYAQELPEQEDMAESFAAYVYVEHLSDRIPQSMKDKIVNAIPNRLEYFRARQESYEGMWCPIVLSDCPWEQASDSSAPERETPAVADHGDGDWTDLKRYRPTVLRHHSSESSSVETAILFVNDTESDISIHWVGLEGKLVKRGVIARGEAAPHDTFKGHLWAVKDANGEVVAVFRAESRPGRALVRAAAE